MIVLAYKENVLKWTIAQALLFLSIVYFFEWYCGFLSSVYDYIVEKDLFQPIATILTGALAVLAVVITQRGFNNRQLEDHKLQVNLFNDNLKHDREVQKTSLGHDKQLKQSETDLKRLEDLFALCSQMKRDLLDFKPQNSRPQAYGITGPLSEPKVDREALAYLWGMKAKDLDLNIELSTALIGTSLSEALTVGNRGVRLVAAIKSPVPNTLTGEIGDYIKAIESYQKYVLREIKTKSSY